MKLIELSFSGHYRSRFIEVTEEEWEEINRLQKNAYLQDTTEGQELIDKLSKRKETMTILQVIAYI